MEELPYSISLPSSTSRHVFNAEYISATRDAFTKREQASEDYAIKQREIEKLKALKDKVAAHKKHLDELDKNMYVSPSSPSHYARVHL